MNNEGLSTHTRQEFCLALRTARERKGITLTEIANATKIPAYLFAALERNDLRRWPKGLFRRSFFRDYVRMIGLPVAETCDEFVLLFPDDAGAALTKSAGAANEAERVTDVRLALDPAWHGPRASLFSRLLAALIDAMAVIIAASAIAWVAGRDLPTTTAIFALTYFSVATALFGASPATWAISRRALIVDALAHGRVAIATSWRRGTAAISSVFGNADGGTAERVEEPEVRAWVTDAHRIGPSSGLRVRIKVPQ